MGVQRTRSARQTEESKLKRSKWKNRGLVTLEVISYTVTVFEFVQILLRLAGF